MDTKQNDTPKRRDFFGASDPYSEAGGDFRQHENDKVEAEANKANGTAVYKTNTSKLEELGCIQETEEVDAYSSHGDLEIAWNMPTRKETYWVDANGNRLVMVNDHYIIPGNKIDTEEEAKSWVISQLTANDNEIETYQRIHQPEPYCIDRAEVIGGKVVRAYVHALYAELVGDWTLPKYCGMTVAQIEALGFKTGYNPDIITMCNNYQTGSTYHGLQASHGNKNIPTQTYATNTRRKCKSKTPPPAITGGTNTKKELQNVSKARKNDNSRFDG